MSEVPLYAAPSRAPAGNGQGIYAPASKRDQIVFFDCLDVPCKSPDYGERECKART